MPLHSSGDKEARTAAELLKKEINSSSVAIFSSHYTRAVQTAEIIEESLGTRKVKQSVFLAERHYGEEEGSTNVDNFQDKPMERHAYNKAGHLAYTPVRGESLFDVHMRVALFTLRYDSFRFIPSSVIVSHASTCLMLHAYFTGEMPTKEDKWGNCEIRKYVALAGSSEFSYKGKIE
jgi:broad specificity phosphatase PhoE